MWALDCHLSENGGKYSLAVLQKFLFCAIEATHLFSLHADKLKDYPCRIFLQFRQYFVCGLIVISPPFCSHFIEA